MSEAAKKLAEAPKKKLGLGEKRIGKIDGADWWTNFHVMFRGKLKNGRPLDVAKPEKMKIVYDEATKGANLEPLEFVELATGCDLEQVILKTVRDRRSRIQKVYYDYCLSNDYALFEGNEAKSVFDGKHRYIVAKEGDEIVGIVMPCRE